MSAAHSSNWTQAPERSNMLALRVMVWLSTRLGRRISRMVLHLIATYFLALAPKARQASRSYLRRATGRQASWLDVYQHFLAFATTVHDRIYLLNNQFEQFEIDVQGGQALLDALERGRGALLVGAHLGSFEVLRAIGREMRPLRVAMVMYEDNAKKIMAALAAINPAAKQDIVTLGRPSSMMEVRDKLDDGFLVGILADRSIGGDAPAWCEFLGEQAAFPSGPFRMAALLQRQVFFMTGLYLGGNRYRVHFEQLADFSQVSRAERAVEVVRAQQVYADRLTHFCQAAPHNWFNFFDFWYRR